MPAWFFLHKFMRFHSYSLHWLMGSNRQNLLSLSHFKHKRTHTNTVGHCIRIEQFSNSVNQLRCHTLSLSFVFGVYSFVFAQCSFLFIFIMRTCKHVRDSYSLTESNWDSLLLLLAYRLICSTAFHHRFATRCAQ